MNPLMFAIFEAAQRKNWVKTLRCWKGLQGLISKLSKFLHNWCELTTTAECFCGKLKARGLGRDRG